ncbi:MAG: 23S rRNA (guanosine(2251)-2'-O)-methyltransferase RlmB [bacterium]|nr:23S rRNA (guanosine(2251)-2'-O)-methyltransferase RlmB [bacterium]
MAQEVEVLYGVAPVEAALGAGRRRLVRLWHKEGGKNPRHVEPIKAARRAKLEVRPCGSDQLFKLTGSKMHQGLALECGPLEPLGLEDLLTAPAQGERQLIVALDQIEDPQNLGAIARSAHFLGAQGLLVPRSHSAPLSPTAVKASAGALETCPLAEVGNLAEALERLKEAGYWVLGASLDTESLPLAQALLAERMVLVLGNEGEGLRNLTAKRCDQLVRIEGSGAVESMNVSASAAIFLHHFLTQKAP